MRAEKLLNIRTFLPEQKISSAVHDIGNVPDL
jgi:hypothetical protein